MERPSLWIGTGSNFVHCSRLGVSKRKEVVSILVEKLRDSIPSCDNALPVINPAALISSTLSMECCLLYHDERIY